MLLLAGEALLMARNDRRAGDSSEIDSKYFLAAPASPAGSLTAKAAEDGLLMGGGRGAAAVVLGNRRNSRSYR